MSVFQDLYHSEINFSVSTFWDGGFDVKLGDQANGFVAETTITRWGEVEPWLRDAAIRCFPESLFAKMYRDGLHVWLTYRGQETATNGALDLAIRTLEGLAKDIPSAEWVEDSWPHSEPSVLSRLRAAKDAA